GARKSASAVDALFIFRLADAQPLRRPPAIAAGRVIRRYDVRLPYADIRPIGYFMSDCDALTSLAKPGMPVALKRPRLVDGRPDFLWGLAGQRPACRDGRRRTAASRQYRCEPGRGPLPDRQDPETIDRAGG